MIKFNTEHLEMFLGVVRKYMQIRGGLSQKDLSVKIKVGISTMSRFLNQKTKELDPQLIASIVAVLNIPLHEVIDFIEEDSTQTFKKLVSFYKEDDSDDKSSGSEPTVTMSGTPHSQDEELESFEQSLDEKSSRIRTSATIKGINVPFGERRSQDNDNLSIRDKLNQLSPRQKGFLTDFLDLDVEGRDLIVDVSNSLFRYFKQGQADF